MNKDNAAIYGLSNSGTALTKVALDPVQRPGFLTRAGFLSSYAHYDSTAPILRGAFITKYITGVDPGPPPPGTSMIQPPPGSYLTNRERTEALVESVGELHGVPHQRPQSSRFRARELRRHRGVADDRQARSRADQPGRRRQLRRRQHQDDPQRPGADAGARPDPEGTVHVRAEPGLLWLSDGIRTRTISASSTRSAPSWRDGYAILNRVHRSHPGGFLPLAGRVRLEDEAKHLEHAHGNESKSLPPGPGRGGRRGAVSQLRLGAPLEGSRRPPRRSS